MTSPNWWKNRQLPTIRMSTPIKTCQGKVTRHLLLTVFWPMSVPPVLSLFREVDGVDRYCQGCSHGSATGLSLAEHLDENVRTDRRAPKKITA